MASEKANPRLPTLLELLAAVQIPEDSVALKSTLSRYRSSANDHLVDVCGVLLRFLAKDSIDASTLPTLKNSARALMYIDPDAAKNFLEAVPDATYERLFSGTPTDHLRWRKQIEHGSVTLRGLSNPQKYRPTRGANLSVDYFSINVGTPAESVLGRPERPYRWEYPRGTLIANRESSHAISRDFSRGIKSLRALHPGPAQVRGSALVASKMRVAGTAAACVVFEDSGYPSFIFEDVPEWVPAKSIGRHEATDGTPTHDLAVFVSRAGEQNHYHHLLNLAPLLHASTALELGCPIQILDDLREVDLAVLEILGIDPEVFTPLSESRICADVGVAPDLGPARLPFVRAIQERLQDLDVISNRRLYVSRRGTTNRCLRNEQEVERLLQRYGFEIVRAEQLNVAEQIALFTEAAVICGPHGAGLTNMLFASPGCSVIELLSAGYPEPVFRELAGLCGHKYSAIVSPHENSLSAEDWECDLNDVATALDELVSLLNQAERS